MPQNMGELWNMNARAGHMRMSTMVFRAQIFDAVQGQLRPAAERVFDDTAGFAMYKKVCSASGCACGRRAPRLGAPVGAAGR